MANCSKSLVLPLVLLQILCLFKTRAAIVPIAGYTPGTDVTEHSEIDLDQDNMNVMPGTNSDFSALITAYTVGGQSVKSNGAIRTLQGFSTGLDAKACPGGACIEPMFEHQKTYWNSGVYANNIVMAALDGTGVYANKDDWLRKEVAVKGSAYAVAGMYAVHEMEDAIADCKAGALNDNQDGVHAWDEAVAFYAGSLEGQSAGGNSAGEMSYRLAEKRCGNFNTCTGAGGISAVNEKIMIAFATGRDALQAGNCDGGKTQMAIVKKQMLVPLVQGMMRYAWKADAAEAASNGYADKSAATKAKEIGEGWAFAVAVLGEVNHCDSIAAAVIRKNMDVAATVSVADGWKEVLKAVTSVNGCLGITCTDMGGLVATTTPLEFYWNCDDLSSAPRGVPLAPAAAMIAVIMSAIWQ